MPGGAKVPPIKLVRAVENLRHHLYRLHQRLVPPPVAMTGFSGPIGAEIFSAENRARTLEQAVADNYEAMANSVRAAA
jgi:hypothetical protein